MKQVRSEICTDKLKGTATIAAINIAESVGSLFGSNKFKQLDRENTALRHNLAASEETIELLQDKIQTQETEHGRQLLEIQRQYLQEKIDMASKHKLEASRINALLIKASDWFPMFRTMLYVEKLCLTIGFTHEQTKHLMTGKPLVYNDKLHFDEHKRKFKTDDVTAQVGKKEGELILAINEQHIGEWFKE